MAINKPLSVVYAPDFKKTPLEITLGLINHDNNKGYTEADVNWRAVTALLDGDASGKNTSLELDLLKAPSEVDGDWVKFWFNRVDLSVLFSAIVTGGLNNLKEITVILNDGQLDVPAFIAEVMRKYSIALNVTDFEITMPTSTRIEVKAVPGNYAFIGMVAFSVDSSLETRVVIKDLEGFLIGSIDLTLPKPVIESQTESATSVVGTPVTLAIVVTSDTGAHTVQYMRKVGADWVAVDGADTASFSYTPVEGDIGTVEFSAWVTNATDTTESAIIPVVVTAAP